MEVPATTLSTALAQHVLGIACFLVGNRLHNNRRQLATRMSHLRPVGCARWRSDVKDLPRGPVGLSSRRHSRKGGRKTRVRCAAKLHTLNTEDVTVVTAAKATLPTAAKATATYGSGYLYSDPVLPILPKPAATNRQRALGHHLAVPKWLNCLAESTASSWAPPSGCIDNCGYCVFASISMSCMVRPATCTRPTNFAG